jgi:hypothetical protein
VAVQTLVEILGDRIALDGVGNQRRLLHEVPRQGRLVTAITGAVAFRIAGIDFCATQALQLDGRFGGGHGGGRGEEGLYKAQGQGHGQGGGPQAGGIEGRLVHHSLLWSNL